MNRSSYNSCTCNTGHPPCSYCVNTCKCFVCKDRFDSTNMEQIKNRNGNLTDEYACERCINELEERRKIREYYSTDTSKEIFELAKQKMTELFPSEEYGENAGCEILWDIIHELFERTKKTKLKIDQSEKSEQTTYRQLRDFLNGLPDTKALDEGAIVQLVDDGYERIISTFTTDEDSIWHEDMFEGAIPASEYEPSEWDGREADHPENTRIPAGQIVLLNE